MKSEPQQIERIIIQSEILFDNSLAEHAFLEKCMARGIRINPDKDDPDRSLKVLLTHPTDDQDLFEFPDESYLIRTSGKNEITLSAPDKRGFIYGLQTLYESLFVDAVDFSDMEIYHQPAFEFRAIKFNLPWNSYREHESLQLHSETIQDLAFWESFLDMMSENRFNTLSLWSVHPWTYMVRPEKYPEACPFSDEELVAWQDFWHRLFAMAGERGIKVFMVNWNIFVSPEFSKAHGVADYSQHLDRGYNGDGDYSSLVQDYNKEAVKQVLETYPGLAGIGVSQNERMKGEDVSEEQWQQWIVDTYFDLVREARPAGEFILRGHTHPAPELTRAAIEENADRLPPKVWVPLKYNWSHGHALPELHYIHGGSTSDIWWNPVPEHYKVLFTIRNEDFFVLRWGSHSFIRELLSYNRDNEAVGGFIIGSETYIPARDYITKAGAHVSWKYAFERQWLFYQLWGRLMYNPELYPDPFIHTFNEKYKTESGTALLQAFDLASQMPLRLASYYGATWDFTLYSEGFLAGYRPWRGEQWDPYSPFLSVEDIIGANPIDSNWLNVAEYVEMLKGDQGIPEGSTTPANLADELRQSGTEALQIASELDCSHPTLLHEIADIQAWSYLSLYFAHKLNGSIAFQRYREGGGQEEKQEAEEQLQLALECWDKLIKVTDPYFEEIPLLHLRDNYIEETFEEPLMRFSWKALRPQVVRDLEYVRQWSHDVK